jgi:hypothetical protein
MPDKRAHRGAHPEDREKFAPAYVPVLAQAVAELSWLLTHGYAEKASRTLVGDHYQLTDRQRSAVMRCACADEARARRLSRQVAAAQLGGERLALDGYNVLTSVEAALAGGALFLGRDLCLRDVASMHGSYRKVQETLPAVDLIGQTLARLGVAGVLWYLDAPVSNSGRLKTILREQAGAQRWDWQIKIVPSPDHELMAETRIVATSDSVILDHCQRWFNLTRQVIQTGVPQAWFIDLSGGGAP